jgi:hypothetical protein
MKKHEVEFLLQKSAELAISIVTAGANFGEKKETRRHPLQP